MKNIIQWSSTKRVDTFKRKLLSRLKLVLKPLLQRIEKDYKQEKDRLDFSRLSQKDKQSTIEMQLLKFFKQKSWIHHKFNLSIAEYKKDIIKFSSKNLNKSKKYMYSFITLSSTKEYLKYNGINRMRVYGLELLKQVNQIKQVNQNILFISIRKIPKSRLEDLYPEAIPIVSGKVLEFSTQNNLKMRYLFISNVKSIEEFTKELEIICQELI